jgi:uncharacterized protein related to proFAR isomerase
MIKSIFRTIAAWSEYWTSPEERKKRKIKKLERKIQKLKKSVVENDEDVVNNRLQKHLIKIIILCVCTYGVCIGCQRLVITYVPADERAIPMTHNGVKGWFVPNSVFTLLLEKAERWDAIQRFKNTKENS